MLVQANRRPHGSNTCSDFQNASLNTSEPTAYIYYKKHNLIKTDAGNDVCCSTLIHVTSLSRLHSHIAVLLGKYIKPPMGYFISTSLIFSGTGL